MDKGAGAQPSEDATNELKALKEINTRLCYGEHLAAALGAYGDRCRDLEKRVASLREQINDLRSACQDADASVIDGWRDLEKQVSSIWEQINARQDAPSVINRWRDLEKPPPSLREQINDLLRQSQLLHAYVIDHWHDLMEKHKYYQATTAITYARRYENVLRRLADDDDIEAVWQKVFRLTVKRLTEKGRPEHEDWTRSVMLAAPMRFVTFILGLLGSARSIDEQYGERSKYKSKLKAALKKSNELARKAINESNLKAALKKSNEFAPEAINAAFVREKRLLLRRAYEELDDYDWVDRAWPEGMRSAQFFSRKYPDEELPPPRKNKNGSRVKRLFVEKLSNFLEDLAGEQLYEEVAYFTEIVLDITIDRHEVRAIVERPTDRGGRKARSRKEK